MSEYVFLGYEKRTYTNKSGNEVVGYNFFYAYPQEGTYGFKPAMRFDSARKSLGYCYLNEKTFNGLGVASLAPLSRVFLSFNMYGSVETVTPVKKPL